MTDDLAASDTDIAERLARLQSRRSSSRADDGSTNRAASSTESATATTPPATSQANRAPVPRRGNDRAAPLGREDADRVASRPTLPSRSRRRRRSPAATAKIVTVGASTTAMLGLIAGYGYAEGRPEGPALADPPSVPEVPAAGGQLPVAPAAASTPASPHVIVVLVDQATGEHLTTVAGATRGQAIDRALDVVGDLDSVAATAWTVPASDAPAIDDSAAVVTAAPATPTDVVVAEPAPVPAPIAVDLAVPVPPPPPAAPAAPAPASAPAPAPAPQATSGGS